MPTPKDGGGKAIRSRWPLIALAAAGLAVTAVAYLLANSAEEQRLRNTLELRVAFRSQEIERKIDAAREALVATAVFLGTQDQIDPLEFARFTVRARRANRPIAALDWAPRVSGPDREMIEAGVTAARGRRFEFMRRGPEGRFVPAEARDEYFPILYQTRFEDFPSVEGFDMGSDPARLVAIQAARDTGRPKATLSVQALATNQRTFIAFWPVYATGQSPETVEQRRATLRGVAIGVFRIGAVLTSAIADTPDIVETIDFRLDDDSRPASGGPASVTVARYSPLDKKLHFDIGEPPPTAYRFNRSFDIMGQRWGLEFLFSNAAVKAERSDGPLAVLVAGLLLTAILVLYVGRERSRLARIQNLVDARTAELTASEERVSVQAATLSDAVNALADGFVLYDADDRLVLCNERYRELRGHDPILARPGVRFEDIVRAAINRGALRIQGNVDTWMRERLARHRDPHGAIVSQVGDKWFRVSEHKTSDGGTVAIHADITEMKNAETEVAITARALKNSIASFKTANDKLQTLIDASPLPIVSLDAAHRVTIWNSAAERSFGYTADEVLGQPYPLAPPAGREEFERLFQNVINGAALRDIAVQRQHKDGRMLDIVFSGAPLHDGGQGIVGAVYVLEDVTEKLKIEQQLSQAQKMEAVGQLSGGIAHDFNNILGVVVGNLDEQSELLQKRADSGAKEDDIQLLGNEALNAALRGAELVRRLLAFSRNQPLRPTTLDVAKLIRDIEPLLWRTLGEQIIIETKIPDELWPVIADQAQFENVILNLAINARDAMPSGGKLTIACQNVNLDEAAAAASEVRAADYVALSVADTGVGIPADILPRVFEPFFTTKEVGKGSGLGLSMVFGYARQSGGTVKIYSEVGHGTEVRIYLPRGGDAATTGTENARRSEPAPAGRELILVVEDKIEVRNMASKLLESLGYSVMQAENGEAAVAALDRVTPDLLFTDIVMPGKMSGIDVAREARRRFPGLPIVFTSGFSNPETVHAEAVALDAALISKPYRKVDLAKLIRASFDRAKG